MNQNVGKIRRFSWLQMVKENGMLKFLRHFKVSKLFFLLLLNQFNFQAMYERSQFTKVCLVLKVNHFSLSLNKTRKSLVFDVVIKEFLRQ